MISAAICSGEDATAIVVSSGVVSFLVQFVRAGYDFNCNVFGHAASLPRKMYL